MRTQVEIELLVFPTVLAKVPAEGEGHTTEAIVDHPAPAELTKTRRLANSHNHNQ